MGFQIESIHRDHLNQTARLTWDSEAGAVYEVFETPDLKTYTSLGTVTGDGGSAQFTDMNAPEPCMFYILESTGMDGGGRGKR